MASDHQIAEALLATCLQAGHKPGKIQFTKYLYLLDYCHWRFTGRKATSLPWKFYHYGPWCEQVEDCMADLASQYAFNWREEEAPFINSVEVPTHRLDITTTSLMNHLIGANHMHASGQTIHNIDTDLARMIPFRIMAKRFGARTPAAALGATWQSAVGVQVLVVGICFPLVGLASASEHHARSVRGPARLRFDRRRQVHQAGDGT